MTKKRKRKNGNSASAELTSPTTKMLKKSKMLDLPTQDKAELDILFNKKLTYSPIDVLGLDPLRLIAHIESSLKKLVGGPNAETAVSSWKDEELMRLKKETNDLKDQLSSKDIEAWHNHTTECNLACKIIPYVKSLEVELCTQAWVKFYEILTTYRIVPDEAFLSVHLCEAPGAFIASLNNLLQQNGFPHPWDWIATTLNPYHEANTLSEMIADDRLIRSTHHKWYFGQDGTGDIKSRGHIEGLVGLLHDMEKKKKSKVLLVTADGSKDCQENPAEQEALLSQLQYTEMLAGCLVLAPSGTLVVKVFTMFEAATIGFMALLNVLFHQVHCIKPATSKSGNSEVYLVCQGYHSNIDKQTLWKMLTIVRDKGFTEFLSKDQIPSPFLEEHRSFCHQFAKWQSDTISRNMRLFDQKSPDILERLDRQQEAAVDLFEEKTNVHYNHRYRRVMGFCREKSAFYVLKLHKEWPGSEGRTKSHHFQWQHKNLKGTFHLRQNINTLSFTERINLMDIRPLITPNTGLICRFPLDAQEIQEWMCHKNTASIPSAIRHSRLCEGTVIDDYNFLLNNSQFQQCRKEHKHRHVKAVADLLLKVMTSLTAPEEMAHGKKQPQPQHHRQQQQHHHHQHQRSRYQTDDTRTSPRTLSNNGQNRLRDDNWSHNLTTAADATGEKRQSLVTSSSASTSPARICESDALPTQPTHSPQPVDSEFEPRDIALPEVVWIKNDTNECDEHRLLLETFLESQEIDPKVKVKVEDLRCEEEKRDLTWSLCTGSDVIYFQNLTLLFSGVDVGDDIEMCEESVTRRFCLEQISLLLKRVPPGSHVVLLTGSFVTRFHTGLLYLLARHFRSIRVTSEPNLWLHQAVVCEGYQGIVCPSLLDFLSQTLRQIEEEEENEEEGMNDNKDDEEGRGRRRGGGVLKGRTNGVVETVPFIHMLNDRKFSQFVVNCNNFLLAGFVNLVLTHHKQDGQKDKEEAEETKEGENEGEHFH